MINFKRIFFVLIHPFSDWISFCGHTAKRQKSSVARSDLVLLHIKAFEIQAKYDCIRLNLKLEEIIHHVLYTIRAPPSFPCPNFACHYAYETRGWTHCSYGACSKILMCWYSNALNQVSMCWSIQFVHDAMILLTTKWTADVSERHISTYTLLHLTPLRTPRRQQFDLAVAQCARARRLLCADAALMLAAVRWHCLHASAAHLHCSTGARLHGDASPALHYIRHPVVNWTLLE